MSGHERRSPSKLPQLELCAGSGQAQEGRQEAFKPSSAQGTAAHEVFEYVLNTGRVSVLNKDRHKVRVSVKEAYGMDEDSIVVT